MSLLSVLSKSFHLFPLAGGWNVLRWFIFQIDCVFSREEGVGEGDAPSVVEETVDGKEMNE